MHRFATRSILIRLRLAALLLIVFTASCALSPLAVAWGVLIHDPRGIQASFILIPTVAVSGILFLMVGSGVRCPLCRGPVLRRPAGVSVNSKARRLLGSYRFRVICGLFFAGHFRCFHCGEACDAQVPRR